MASYSDVSELRKHPRRIAAHRGDCGVCLPRMRRRFVRAPASFICRDGRIRQRSGAARDRAAGVRSRRPLCMSRKEIAGQHINRVRASIDRETRRSCASSAAHSGLILVDQRHAGRIHSNFGGLCMCGASMPRTHCAGPGVPTNFAAFGPFSQPSGARVG
jgi:hypothetical protein